MEITFIRQYFFFLLVLGDGLVLGSSSSDSIRSKLTSKSSYSFIHLSIFYFLAWDSLKLWIGEFMGFILGEPVTFLGRRESRSWWLSVTVLWRLKKESNPADFVSAKHSWSSCLISLNQKWFLASLAVKRFYLGLSRWTTKSFSKEWWSFHFGLSKSTTPFWILLMVSLWYTD